MQTTRSNWRIKLKWTPIFPNKSKKKKEESNGKIELNAD